MSKSVLGNPIFADAAKARVWLENLVLPSRPGCYPCNARECGKQFTVSVGTVFERSHIP